MQNQSTADQHISNVAAVNAAINSLATRKSTVPIAIHIICVLTAIVLGIATLASWILELFVSVSTYFWGYVDIAIAANLAAIIGMWMMKKWGAYLYAAVFVIGVIYLIYVDSWFLNIGFVINLAATGTALFYSNRMS